MSYFGTQLDELLKRKKMKAADLARLSGVGEPTISRYRRGEQIWVDPGDLARLSRTISDRPHEQAELIRARLLDENQGPGSELVRIEISGSELKESPHSYGIRLANDLEQAITVIRENIIKDQNVREIVLALGNLLSSGDCRVPGETAPSSGPAVSASKRGKLGKQQPLTEQDREDLLDAVKRGTRSK